MGQLNGNSKFAISFRPRTYGFKGKKELNFE